MSEHTTNAANDDPRITIVVEREPLWIWADPNEAAEQTGAHLLAFSIENELRRPFMREVKERGFDPAVATLRELLSDRALLEGVAINIEERETPSAEEVQTLNDALMKLGEKLNREAER